MHQQNVGVPLRLWLPPLAAVIIYPGFFILFARAIDEYRESGNPFFAAGAALLMVIAGSIPVLAARGLFLMRHVGVSRVLARSVLYLMFAVSPLYTLMLVVAWRAGLGSYHNGVWVLAWIAAGAFLYFSKGTHSPQPPAAEAKGLRMVHGVAALCLLCGFLIVHLVNHTAALWSVGLHRTVMEGLRLWYRAEWVEPVLLVLLLVMISTGIPLVIHHSRRTVDRFRILQMATGVFIGLFLCAHVLAVTGARNAGIDTDWVFATGPRGLSDGRSILIPYYSLAVFLLILHAACGLRMVLIKHGAAEGMADKTFYSLAGVGLIATSLIAMAALGLHVQDS